MTRLWWIPSGLRSFRKRTIAILLVLSIVATLSFVTGLVGHAAAKVLVTDKTQISANNPKDCTPMPTSAPTMWDCSLTATYNGDSKSPLTINVTTSDALTRVTFDATPKTVVADTSGKKNVAVVTVHIPFQDTATPPHDNCVKDGQIIISDGADTADPVTFTCQHYLSLVGQTNFKVITQCPGGVCNVTVVNSSKDDLSLGVTVNPSTGVTVPSGTVTVHPNEPTQIAITVDLTSCTADTVAITIGTPPNDVSANLDCTNLPNLITVKSVDSMHDCNQATNGFGLTCHILVQAKSDLSTYTASSTTIPGIAFDPIAAQVSNVSPVKLTITMPSCVQGTINLSNQNGQLSIPMTCSTFKCGTLHDIAGLLNVDEASLTQGSDTCKTDFAGSVITLKCPDIPVGGDAILFNADWLGPNHAGLILNCKPGARIINVRGFSFLELGGYSTGPLASNDLPTIADTLFGKSLKNSNMLIIFTDQQINVTGLHSDHIIVEPLSNLNKAA